MGTPRALTDQNKNIVWQSSYTPFGEATKSVTTVENNLRFPGQYFDRETKLHYNWHRYYDPLTDRFTQSDPTGLFDGTNTYIYAHSNPLKYADLNGLWSVRVGFYSGGRGGALTFGTANGRRFFIVDAGIGKGVGFSYDPDGDFPRPEGVSVGCEPEAWIGFQASAGANAGPINVGAAGYTGMYAGDGKPIFDEGVGPYTTGSRSWSFGATASAGTRVGFSWQVSH